MLNKKALAKRISYKTLLTQKESIQVVDILFDLILEELKRDGEVSIVNFGKFYLYKQKPRPVRNPKTKEEMVLDEFKTLKFKPSIYIKNILKDME